MRLRQTIHAPKRFGEDEQTETFERTPSLPTRAHPYDPTLPEAAFPTLQWPRVPSDNVNTMETISSQPMELDDSLDETELQMMETPASTAGKWMAPQEPGQFEHNQFNDVNDLPRISGLKAYDIVLEWHMIADGMKLIILSEMTQRYGIEDAVENLGLRDKDIDYLARLQERERLREIEEQDRIARNNAQHLQILLNGTDQVAQSAATAQWQSNLGRYGHGPSWFSNSRKDIGLAYQYLRLHGEKDIASRMWDYYGVDTRAFALNLALPVNNIRQQGLTSMEESEHFDQFHDAVLEPEQQIVLPIDNEAADPTFQQGSGRTKRKYTKRSDTTQSGQKQSGTRKKGTRPPKGSILSGSAGSVTLTLRAPSGLRNVISAEDIRAENETPKLCNDGAPPISSPTVEAMARRGRGRPKKQITATGED